MFATPRPTHPSQLGAPVPLFTQTPARVDAVPLCMGRERLNMKLRPQNPMHVTGVRIAYVDVCVTQPQQPAPTALCSSGNTLTASNSSLHRFLRLCTRIPPFPATPASGTGEATTVELCPSGSQWQLQVIYIRNFRDKSAMMVSSVQRTRVLS
ncbi:hypothetical protein EDB84DRAFT_1642996 [Lactarius hengduanensis]|nr:hypothetical protein EDB84DRAFT_1642996 [Lactarius hengduanensis]